MTININLLPWREELKEQQKKAFLILLSVGIFIACAGMFCVHILVGQQIKFQNENNAYLKNEIRILDLKIAEIINLEKEKKQLLAKMEVIQQLQASRPQTVRLFDGIARILPQGMFLTNLTRTGKNILIDGKTESNSRVSTFMRNIEASNWITSPLLSMIQADDKKEDDKAKPADRLIGFNLQAIETPEPHEIVKSKEIKKS